MSRTRRGRTAAVAACIAAVALLVVPMADASHVLSISSDSEPPGSIMRIDGQSQYQNRPCTVTFAGTVVPVRDGTCGVDEQGAVDERFEVPEVARDETYKVEFWVGEREPTLTSARPPRFAVLEDEFYVYVPPPPAITVSPTQGPPGTTVRVTGSDFASPCAVHFDQNQQVGPAECDVTGNGTIDETFRIPSSAVVGDHSIRACSRCGGPGQEWAGAGFRVTEPDEGRTVRIDPVEGPPGTSARVAGDGWDRATALTVHLDGEVLADLHPGDDRFGGDGSFDVTVEVPDRPSGPVDVTACQRCVTEFETSARTTFTVVPLIAVVPAVLRRGEMAMVSGRGFPADAAITLRWQPGVGQVVIRTNETGRLVTTSLLAFPKDLPGQRRVVAFEQPDPRRLAESELVLVVPGSAQPRDFVSRR